MVSTRFIAALALACVLCAISVQANQKVAAFQYASSSDCTGIPDASEVFVIGKCFPTPTNGYVKVTTNTTSCGPSTGVIASFYNMDNTCTNAVGAADEQAIGVCTPQGSILYCVTSSGSDDCFPADATVELESGAARRMDELAVTDRVRSAAGEFSDVHFFSHDMDEVTATFVELSTASGHRLALTSKHYVFANGQRVQAKDVKVGDSLELANGTMTPVVKISQTVGQGLYNPHTLTGDVVVNGIRTSCYTGSVEPTLAHTLLWPLRMMYQLGVTVLDRLPESQKLRDLVLSVLPQGH